MKSDKKKGKRGRPKKIHTKIEEVIIKTKPVKVIGEENISIITPEVKRKRGRPAKVNKDEGGIKVKESPILEEEYIQPKILRKKRVFRFDKQKFHEFAKRYEGNLVIMSFVFDRLMQKYIDHKIKIPIINEPYYSEWCKDSPPIEPVEEKEISSHNAFVRGVPMQYKYSLLIDEEVFSKFEQSCKRYPPYISNELLKMLLDEKNNINISTSKYREWCTL